MKESKKRRTRARESRAAIERLYIAMRHLFIRGYYKPFGVSGMAIIEALKDLSPEIYGDITHKEKVELEGLSYVINRLPKGVEECRLIKLISDEGYRNSSFPVIVPAKRRRNCYRIDKEEMFIEVTRGRSEIYDILTHLTFLFVEAEKIAKNAVDEFGNYTREFKKIEEIVQSRSSRMITKQPYEIPVEEINLIYLSTLLGRTFEDVETIYRRFNEEPESYNDLFHVTYWLGKTALADKNEKKEREISFTSTLRDRIGHHIYGGRWAKNIKKKLFEHGLMERPIHIISANLHSVLNCFFAHPALDDSPIAKGKNIEGLAVLLSDSDKAPRMDIVTDYADSNGMMLVEDISGTNLHIQIFDTAKIDLEDLSPELKVNPTYIKEQKPVILVMDYAFGEQAFETMDELLRSMYVDGKEYPMKVESISIMGKAGTLTGKKGDIMVPNAHVFEGTADNYPFKNDLSVEDFQNDHGMDVFEGPMITVLGTSLQNTDVLNFFKESSWHAIGLEMEGAHYQKAIQAASKIRNVISEDVTLRYAYYASDNPLLTGSTLASGGLGLSGVKPTYLITLKILNKILSGN